MRPLRGRVGRRGGGGGRGPRQRLLLIGRVNEAVAFLPDKQVPFLLPRARLFGLAPSLLSGLVGRVGFHGVFFSALLFVLSVAFACERPPAGAASGSSL